MSTVETVAEIIQKWKETDNKKKFIIKNPVYCANFISMLLSSLQDTEDELHDSIISLTDEIYRLSQIISDTNMKAEFFEKHLERAMFLLESLADDAGKNVTDFIQEVSEEYEILKKKQ